MKEKFAGAQRPSESSERSAERLKEDVRGILSRTAQELLAKGRTGFEARRAKGELFEIRQKEIPRRESAPESPELEELRLEAEAILFSPETPTKEEAQMLMKRGMIALAWELSEMTPGEVTLVLSARRKTREGWIQEAVRSLKTLKLSEEEAKKKAARIVDDMMLAHSRL